MRRYPSILALVVLAACSRLPQLEAPMSRVTAQTPYPVLLSLPEIAAIDAAAGSAEAAAAIVQARARALRARAATLRGPVIAAADRRRLNAAMDRHMR